MRILVTGHNGYIGTVMVPILLTAGHDVAGLDSDLFDECTFTDAIPRIPALRKDIRDIEPADLVGFDAIVHLAALSNDPLGDLSPDITYEINQAASLRLARLAREAGVRRFLFSSSCSAYGAAAEHLVTEEAELRPITPYALSKVRVEQEVAQLADAAFTPTYLRNATAYGISPRLRCDLVLNNLVACAFTTGRVHIKSDGTPWRPIVHVEDISSAFLAVLEAPREQVHNHAFNVGVPDENYRIRELADIVRAVVPGSRVTYAPDPGPDPRSYRVDFTKLTRTLPHFKPRWTARQGAEELHLAYEKADMTVEDFQGPRYNRLEHLKVLLSTGRVDSTLRRRVGRAIRPGDTR